MAGIGCCPLPCLGVFAGVAGWRRFAWAAILIIPGAMAVCVSIMGVIDGGALWPIGTILVAIGTFLWVTPIALLTEMVSRRKAR